MKVNVLEARNRLSQLIKAAEAGEDVVIANRGQPVARLVAARAPAATPSHQNAAAPGNPADILNWLRDHPLPAYARRSAAEIDADIAAERDSWD